MNTFKAVFSKEIKSAKSSIFKTNFLSFLGWSIRIWKSYNLFISRKLLRSMIKNALKFDRHGFYHLWATPLWKTIQIHMSHPVDFLKLFSKSLHYDDLNVVVYQSPLHHPQFYHASLWPKQNIFRFLPLQENIFWLSIVSA